MKLYLIRHAQSANNALYARTGSYKGSVPDPDLTEIGHQQAQRLAIVTSIISTANGEKNE